MTGEAGRRHQMGLIGAVSYIIGNVVGSGIFITPSGVLSYVHSPGLSLICWALSAVIALLGSFCYIELGTSIRLSGADFAYLCYVKWFPIAFIFMTCACLITFPACLAIQAATLSEYLFKSAGIKLEDENMLYWAKTLTGFSVIWLLMFLNFFSLKNLVSRFNIFASIAKVAAVGIIVLTGFYYFIFKGWNKSLVHPFEGGIFSVGPFISALFAGLYSYDGWDILNFGMEEIHNPRRTLPLALISGISIIAFLYLSINFAYFVVLDLHEFTDTAVAQDVLQTFGERTLGDAQWIIPFFIVLLLIGSLNSTIFTASRYLQAAGRQGHLPSMFSCTNASTDSPRVAIFVHTLIAMVMSFTGDLNTLVQYVEFVMWCQRAFTMGALLYIRMSGIPVHPEAIRVPIILPIIFFLISISLVSINIATSFSTSVVGLSFLLGALIFFVLFLCDRGFPSLEGYNKCSSYANHKLTSFAQIIFNVVPDNRSEKELTYDCVKIPEKLLPIEEDDSSDRSRSNYGSISD